jgi:tetratricopeptide (TPR) repeat protein
MVLYGALLAALLFAPQQDFLADGIKALDANQPAAAEPLLRQAAAAAPDDFSVHFNLALALTLQGKDPEAIAELRRTLAIKPALFEADLNLGMLLLRDKQPADALPVLKAAVDLKPQDSRANLYLAQAWFDTGDFAQAESRYRAAAEADPKSAGAELGLARSLVKQSKLPEAAQHFAAAATLDPRYRDALLELAGEYDNAHQASAAIGIYRQFPENADAKRRLAELLVQDGDAASAIPALEESVRANPSVANRLALASAYQTNKQPDKFIEQLQMAAASDPANFDVRMGLGRALRDQRKFEAAAAQFATAARLQPDSVKAWNELASALVISENYAQCLAALDRVRALGKEVPGDFYFRALSLDRLRQIKPAIDAYRQFLTIAAGKFPDQEFLARQRVRILENELKRK